MRKYFNLVLLIATCAGLSACGSLTKEKLGMSKKAPNEFMATSRAPLTLPPEYDLLPVNQEKYYNQNDQIDIEGLSEGEQHLLNNIRKAD